MDGNIDIICQLGHSSKNTKRRNGQIIYFLDSDRFQLSSNFFCHVQGLQNLIVVAEYYANVRFQAWTVAGLFSFWRANVAIRADANTCLHFPFTTLSHKAGSY